MLELHCGKCGTSAQPTDRFCRICGSLLESTTVPKERTRNATLDDKNVDTLKLQISNSTACLIAAGFLISTVILVIILFISLANLSGGSHAIAIESIGTSTPYPTRKPYTTAAPYNTPTPYPTAVPYPTTGALTMPTKDISDQPFVYVIPSFGGCRLRVKNQNIDLDSVVILSDVETNAIEVAVYVRANDSISESGISTGTYHTYVATGQDWDVITSRFINYADYFRFKDPVVFDTCPSFGYGFSYGSYQYFEVTLNITEGQGADIIIVAPESFPGYSP
jgi:hypothetical protein